MNLLASLRITGKLYLLIGLAMLVLIAIAGVGQYQLKRVFDLANYAAVETVPAFNSLNTARVHFNRLRVQALYHALNTDEARKMAIDTAITEHRKLIDSSLANYTEKHLADDEDRQLAAKLSAAIKDYYAGVDLALMYSRRDADIEAREALEQQAPTIARIIEAFDSILEYKEQLAENHAATAQAATDRAFVVMVGIVLLTLVLLGVVGWSIGTRDLARPIGEVADYLQKLAAGSMTAEVVGTGRRDEIGDIARAAQVFKEYVAKLDTQTWIKTHAAEIAAALQQPENFRTLTQTAISRIAPVMGAGHGAFYVLDSDGRYNLLASYGYRERKQINSSFSIGEGLVGQCAMEKAPIVLTAPKDYIRINSGLGEGPPASIIVQPIIHGERVLGVLELASFQQFSEREKAVLDALQPVLASSMEILDRNLKTRELLAATQEQAQRMEMQAARLEEQTVEMEAQQAEIKAAEERSRLILGSVKDGIVGLDCDGRITFANAASYTMLGYMEQDFLGKPVHALIHHHYPDGRELPHEECAMYLSSCDGQPRTVDDEVLWHKDGTAMPVEYSVTPVFSNGKLGGTVVVYRDISTHKQAEREIATINERFELVNQATSEGLWDMTVVAGDPVNMANEFWWADKFRSMLGFTDENDFPNVLGSWANRLHPDDKERTLTAFAAHLNDRSGKTPYDIEYRLQRKDGSYRWYRARGATLRDSNGVPLRVAGSLADISDRKQADCA